MVVVSWSIWYLCASMTSQLEWARCGHDYNTENCFTRENEDLCGHNDSILFRQTCVERDEVCLALDMNVGENATCVNSQGKQLPVGDLIPKTSSVEEYWERHVLGHTDYDWSDFVSLSYAGF